MADRRALLGYASIAANMARTGLQLVRRSAHGHGLLQLIERELRGALPNCSVLTHLELVGGPSSFDDIGLDREPAR